MTQAGMMDDARLRSLVASEKAADVRGPGGLEFMRCMALNSTVVPSLAADGEGSGALGIPKCARAFALRPRALPSIRHVQTGARGACPQVQGVLARRGGAR